MSGDGAVVVLSGGADSTICLYWAKNRFDSLAAITFDYGQRHKVEIECAKTVARKAECLHRVVTVESLKALGGNSLVDESLKVELQGKAGLPNTFVPGRNLIFLTLAAAWAWQLGYRNLVTGVCQTDFSGYPDCREDTMQSLQDTLNKGMNAEFIIHTPLMHLNKAQSILMARNESALEALSDTHTCYEGKRPPCGKCPSCELRAKGFADAKIADPLLSLLI